MSVSAVFPRASPAAGMYESFYLRAVCPERPAGVWIRYTAHKRRGAAPTGSLWFTLFDPERGEPVQDKLTTPALSTPEGGWIAVGEATFDATGASGACRDASWSLRLHSSQPELRHLTPELLYRTPLPRTKLSSPAPLASFDGTVEVSGREPIVLDGWHGMVGHNWGVQHAERWIWLHGLDFADAPGAWLDVAIGRVRVAGRMTPWIANGALFLDGRRHRLGGLLARGVYVREEAGGCQLRLGGHSGIVLQGTVEAPPSARAGWLYADPDGGEHDVVNCSVARLDLTAQLPASPPVALRSAHGGAYELGMREHDHGVPLAPFSDG